MKNTIINLSVSIVSLLVTLIVLEVGTRVLRGEYHFDNFLELRLSLFRSAYPARFDGQLGWVPEVGNHPKNFWNTTVTILDDGVRSNGANDLVIRNETINV
jgi:hypothetical protein